MKYQQLENLESGWKWKYLVKKHREGELITRYIEASAAQEAVDVLLSLENEPVLVNGWIDKHMILMLVLVWEVLQANQFCLVASDA